MNRNILFGFLFIGVGLLGLYYVYAQGQAELEIQRALEIAEAYTESLGEPDLHVAEIMEFKDEFYFIIYEKSTGIGAMEMLINKVSRNVSPEPGPNMMWNIGYGHMGSGMMGGSQGIGSQTVNPEEAVEIAQDYLDQELPEMVAEEPFLFYGYYTLHVLKDDSVHGMLSVNAYNGGVWYHEWHSKFVQSIEDH
jgi:hypothetical protein